MAPARKVICVYCFSASDISPLCAVKFTLILSKIQALSKSLKAEKGERSGTLRRLRDGDGVVAFRRQCRRAPRGGRTGDSSQGRSWKHLPGFGVATPGVLLASRPLPISCKGSASLGNVWIQAPYRPESSVRPAPSECSRLFSAASDNLLTGQGKDQICNCS